MSKAVRIIVWLTCEFNRYLIMGDALLLYELGLIKFYTANKHFQEIFNLWAKQREYAELRLEEFVEKCGIPFSQLLAAQTVDDQSIIPLAPIFSLVGDVDG